MKNVLLMILCLLGIIYGAPEVVATFDIPDSSTKVSFYDYGTDGVYSGTNIYCYLTSDGYIRLVDIQTGTQILSEKVHIFTEGTIFQASRYWFDSDDGIEIIYTYTQNDMMNFIVYDGETVVMDEQGYPQLFLWDNDFYLTNGHFATTYDYTVKTWRLRSNVTSVSRSRSATGTSLPSFQAVNNNIILQIDGVVDQSMSVKVYDLHGRIIQDVPSGKLRSGNNIIDLSNQATGIYLPVVQTSSGSSSQKMIVK